MSSKVYDFLKDCSLIYVGAVGVLYYGLAEIWGLPFGTEVMASCTVVSTFLGTILKLDNIRYNAAIPSELTVEEAARWIEEEGDLDA